MLQLGAMVSALGALLAMVAYFLKARAQDTLMMVAPTSLLLNATAATQSLQDLTEHFGLLDYLIGFIKEQSWHVLMLPSTVFFGGIVFSKAKEFAKEGFRDMFSISITTFVKNADGNDVVAIRTLKEVPIEQIMYDEAATEVMKTAATTNLPEGDEFHFVNFDGLPDARRNVNRLRSHCASEVSALFGVFQALAAMRVGPIACRRFCWAVTYDMEEAEDDADSKKFSFKGAAMSVVAMSRLSSGASTPTDVVPKEVLESIKKKKTKKKRKSTSGSMQLNKFRMILIELDCLRQAHMKSADDLEYEMNNSYSRHRWDTIRAMQNLFCLETGLPPPTSTILCGTVTFSAPLQEEMPAPWEAWEQSNKLSNLYEQQFIQKLNSKLVSKRSIST